jgi:hypothetical protein
LNVSDPLVATLGVQLEVLEANGIGDAVLWLGAPTDLLDAPNPNAHTTEYVCALQN